MILDFLNKYKYRAGYTACLLAALYIANNLIAASPSYEEGFMNFIFVTIIIPLALYFRFKDTSINGK